jgi:hypothetical protein
MSSLKVSSFNDNVRKEGNGSLDFWPMMRKYTKHAHTLGIGIKKRRKFSCVV